MNIIETKVDFLNREQGELTIKRSQEISQEYLDALKAERDSSTTGRMGELHKFASIPVAVYETWLRQGFDVRKETPAKIIAKMQAEGLDYFITTNKRL